MKYSSPSSSNDYAQEFSREMKIILAIVLLMSSFLLYHLTATIDSSVTLKLLFSYIANVMGSGNLSSFNQQISWSYLVVCTILVIMVLLYGLIVFKNMYNPRSGKYSKPVTSNDSIMFVTRNGIRYHQLLSLSFLTIISFFSYFLVQKHFLNLHIQTPGLPFYYYFTDSLMAIFGPSLIGLVILILVWLGFGSSLHDYFARFNYFFIIDVLILVFTGISWLLISRPVRFWIISPVTAVLFFLTTSLLIIYSMDNLFTPDDEFKDSTYLNPSDVNNTSIRFPVAVGKFGGYTFIACIFYLHLITVYIYIESRRNPIVTSNPLDLPRFFLILLPFVLLPFVSKLFSGKNYNQMVKLVMFTLPMTLMMLVPFFADDIFFYLEGIAQQRWDLPEFAIFFFLGIPLAIWLAQSTQLLITALSPYDISDEVDTLFMEELTTFDSAN